MNIYSQILDIQRWLYELFFKPKNKWYIIEGNIGSGKTELLNNLFINIDCEVIKEPVEIWQNIIGDGKNILQQFYEDPYRYAYLFQTVVFKTRLQSIDHPQLKKIRFSERSIWTDKYIFGKSCIESKRMNELEKNAYMQWFDWLEQKFFKKPDGIIYLQCSPEKCFERMNIRNRNEESSVPIEYLKEIHINHEEWLYTWKTTPVLILNNENDNDWINIIKQINHFIN